MHALITHGADHDFELVGDKLYIYASAGTMRHRGGLRSLLAAASEIGRQFDEQARSYSDTRAGNVTSGAVAQEGARLRKKTLPWQIGLGTVAVGAYGYFAFPKIGEAANAGNWLAVIGWIAVAVGCILAIKLIERTRS